MKTVQLDGKYLLKGPADRNFSFVQKMDLSATDLSKVSGGRDLYIRWNSITVAPPSNVLITAMSNIAGLVVEEITVIQSSAGWEIMNCRLVDEFWVLHPRLCAVMKLTANSADPSRVEGPVFYLDGSSDGTPWIDNPMLNEVKIRQVIREELCPIKLIARVREEVKR